MTTCPPVEDAMATLARILTTSRDRSAKAPGILAMLDDADAAVAQLSQQLTLLDDFGVLCSGEDLATRMRGARTLWNSVEAGHRVADVSALVAGSPVLSDLTRAAVTVTAVERFSDDHIAISRRLGSELAAYPQYVAQLAGTSRSADGTFLISPAAAEQLESTLAWLASAGIADGFRIEFTHGGGENAKWLPKAKGRMPGHSRAWRVVRGEVAPEYRSLLAGHWLTAYAAWIAADQFERAGADYEIYTNVEYSLPPDLGGGRSDIDVLVRTDDLLICIECKSGNLTARSGDSLSALDKTAADAARLETVFQRLDLALERRFPLVHTGRTAEAALRLPEGEVPLTLLTPSEIRVAVESLGRAA